MIVKEDNKMYRKILCFFLDIKAHIFKNNHKIDWKVTYGLTNKPIKINLNLIYTF